MPQAKNRAAIWLLTVLMMAAAVRATGPLPAIAGQDNTDSPQALLDSTDCLPAGGAAPASVFADAIAYAQARTVKIYGAGIGREHGYATGLIVAGDGLILTAQGIYLSGSRIRVVLPDGSVHAATIERRSEALQAALLRVSAKTPNYFEVPAVCGAKKGDWVLAVSNLFQVADGAEPLSVNLGVASLRTRLQAKRGTQDVPYAEDMLLVDAITSNPGAAGGALVTVDGKLAGMIGKIIESNSTGTRVNYAVPADLLRKFIDGQLLDVVTAKKDAGKKEAGTSAALGIHVFTLSGKRAPAYVDRVERGSPAEQAGMKKDDLIVSVNGEVVHTVGDYQRFAAALKPGVEVVVLVKRKEQLVRVSLQPLAEKSDEQPSTASEKSDAKSGQ